MTTDNEMSEAEAFEVGEPASAQREAGSFKPRGKYAQVMARLPILLNKSVPYQEKVEDAKRLIKEAFAEDGRPVTAMTLGVDYAQLDTEKEQLEARIKQLNLEMEAVSQLMTAAFEAEGGYSVRTSEGKSITMQTEPYAQVTDRDAYREWCLKEGLERSLMLPWQTTNAMCKRLLLDGLEPPPGVKVFMKIKPVVRKTGDE